MAVDDPASRRDAEIEQLRAENAQLHGLLTDTMAKLTATTEQLQRYEKELLELRKKVFGRTSERSRSSRRKKSPRPKNDARAQRKRKDKRTARKQLPAERVEHTIEEAELAACPNCGADGSFESMPADVSTEYEDEPGRLVQRVHARQKVRCAKCSHFVRTPAPQRVVDGGHCGLVSSLERRSTSAQIAFRFTARPRPTDVKGSMSLARRWWISSTEPLRSSSPSSTGCSRSWPPPASSTRTRRR